jgi:hypothetical protein
MKSSLGPSEWPLVLSLLFIIAALIVVAKINAYRASAAIAERALDREEIVVKVTGAVIKPGEYRIEPGTELGVVLRKARPKINANLQGILMGEQIVEPREIYVEELSEIAVWVQGEVVEPVKIVMPADARISDLRSKISLTEEAEKTFFKSRKRLKNGEIIEVPKKKVE